MMIFFETELFIFAFPLFFDFTPLISLCGTCAHETFEIIS